MPTERLKFVSSPGECLAAMNSRMPGWSTRRMPILAPRLAPPCLMASVAMLKTRMKETGPEATPLVEATRSRLGRRWLNEKPVPPPELVNERLLLHRLENRLQGILDRQDEAGGQLLQRAAGVHEGRRVRQEVEAAHQSEEFLSGLSACCAVAGIERLGRGDVGSHTTEHLRRRFDGRAVGVLGQIASAQHGQGVGRQAPGGPRRRTGVAHEPEPSQAKVAGLTEPKSCYGSL